MSKNFVIYYATLASPNAIALAMPLFMITNYVGHQTTVHCTSSPLPYALMGVGGSDTLPPINLTRD